MPPPPPRPRYGSATPVQETWRFDAVPGAAAELRAELRHYLAVLGVAEDAAEAVVLVASELVSNAVEHARTAAVVAVSEIGRCLRVEVHDGSDRPPQRQPFDLQARRGRGLQVVDRLARQWSWRPDGDGKTVWAEVPLDSFDGIF